MNKAPKEHIELLSMRTFPMGKHDAVLECVFQQECSEATQVQLSTPAE